MDWPLYEGKSMKLSNDVRAYKAKLVLGMLELQHGNIRATAKALGTKPATMQRWVRELELDTHARELRRRRAWWLAPRAAIVASLATVVIVVTRSLI